MTTYKAVAQVAFTTTPVPANVAVGVLQVQLLLNGVPQQIVTVVGGSATFTGIAEGDYVVVVEQFNAAGGVIGSTVNTSFSTPNSLGAPTYQAPTGVTVTLTAE